MCPEKLTHAPIAAAPPSSATGEFHDDSGGPHGRGHGCRVARVNGARVVSAEALAATTPIEPRPVTVWEIAELAERCGAHGVVVSRDSSGVFVDVRGLDSQTREGLREILVALLGGPVLVREREINE